MKCEKCGEDAVMPEGAAWCIACVLKEENCYEED